MRFVSTAVVKVYSAFFGQKSGLQLSNNSINKKHMDLTSGLPLATDTFTDTVLSLLFTSVS
jgi:hypothetical protein